jgi:cell division protease FtsH
VSERGLALVAGMGAGLLLFLAVSGVNVWPVVLLGALVGVLALSRGNWSLFRARVAATGPGLRGVVPAVGFDDVGGQKAAKRELQEALEFLRQPDRIRHLGIRPLKGVLLTGPPGTGKTLLAKAAAHYTGSAFLAASGSEFVEVYAGVGAQRVRQLFDQARRAARREGRGSAIVFIDEIEVMAGRRGQHTSHLEYDQTLNQLLVELDGIADDDGARVLLMAATNRPDLLDPALLRPGRFDRVVRVDLPDREAREQILRIHCRNKPLAPDVDLAEVAAETWGFSGAHLESVANEAAILAMRRGLDRIGRHEFREAVDKVMLGERMDREIQAQDRYRIAVHEGGHALVSELIKPGSVAAVTIAPRGQALGHVRQGQAEVDPVVETASALRNDICVCVAGSVAESLILGERSTGAASDFDKAFQIGRRLVLAGLSPLGPVHEDLMASEDLHRAIKTVIDEAERAVTDLLDRHRPALLALADRLQREETLSGDALRQWLAA